MAHQEWPSRCAPRTPLLHLLGNRSPREGFNTDSWALHPHTPMQRLGVGTGYLEKNTKMDPKSCHLVTSVYILKMTLIVVHVGGRSHRKVPGEESSSPEWLPGCPRVACSRAGSWAVAPSQPGTQGPVPAPGSPGGVRPPHPKSPCLVSRYWVSFIKHGSVCACVYVYLKNSIRKGSQDAPDRTWYLFPAWAGVP